MLKRYTHNIQVSATEKKTREDELNDYVVCPNSHQKSMETRTLRFNHKCHSTSHTVFIYTETLINLRWYFELFQGKYAKVTELKKTEKLIPPLPQSKVKPNKTGLSTEAAGYKSLQFYNVLQRSHISQEDVHFNLIFKLWACNASYSAEGRSYRAFLERGRRVL